MKGNINKYTLVLDKDTLTFKAHETEARVVHVSVNGVMNTDCYDIMTDMDWITISRKLGEVTIIPSYDNNTNFTKEGYIVFYHKADHSISQVIDVIQQNIDFNITVEQQDFIFDLEKEETYTIKINVYGERKRFYINSVNMYDEDNVRLTYDNAFDFRINQITTEFESQDFKEYNLSITSHGMITKDVRYEVILLHSDLRTVTATLNLTYKPYQAVLPKIKSQDFVYYQNID